MRTFILFFILLAFQYCFAQSSASHYLIINPGGHKGQIRSLLVTNDKKHIITGSFDKTIKVWDIETGEQSREILSQIGSGSEGMIYKMALSSDDKLLAVGGWFGDTQGRTENLGDIRVFEFATGKLLYVLKGHVNTIHALEFTDDNKSLLSADAEGDMWLWDLASKKIVRKYNAKDNSLDLLKFSDDVQSISINKNKFVTADRYGRIKLWDIDKKDSLRCDHYYEQIPADHAEFSPDGKWIVAVVDTFFTIYDSEFKPITEGTNQFGFVFAKFSPDSKKIVFGSVGRGDVRECNVFALEGDAWTDHSTFTDVDNSVICGDFIDNETIALAGGNKDEVIVLKLTKKGEKPKVLKRMVGLGTHIYSAALNDKKLAYADEWSENFGFSKYNKQFDLFLKNFEKPSKNIPFAKPVLEKDGISLKRYRIGEDLNAGLYIRKNGKIYDSIPLEYWNGSEHHSFCLANGYVITGNCCGLLRAYNYAGLELSTFVGHVGNIESITISSDGKRLVTASDDRTIKIWSMDEIGKGREVDTIVSIADYCKRMKIYGTYERVFKTINVEKESKLATREAWLKVIDALRVNGYRCQSFKYKFGDFCSNQIFPIVTLFLAENGDWLIWNEAGYFASSKKGSRFVGYHINQGKDKEAKYYPFEQFDLKYNRPDIIMKDLDVASIDVIKAYEMAYQKRLKRMGVNENELSGDLHLPEMNIKNKNFDEATRLVKVSYTAKDDKYKLDRINIFINDVPVYGTKGMDIKMQSLMEFSNEVSLELSPGKNKIQFSVLNEKGVESLKETFVVINKEQTKPDLYIMTIGVSLYMDKKFNLNYAAKDAEDVAAFFEKSNLYNKVYVNKLINEQVTKENILKAKSTFLKNAQTRDVVMVFAAGHGVLDKNMNYYYATHNMDFNNPANGGISYEELEEILNGIKPMKKLFFMDSCHSGELDKDDYVVTENNTKSETGEVMFRAAGDVAVEAKSELNLNQSSQLASDLFADLRRGSGATIISSAGGAEFAMESSVWKNGLFTFCFLSGLKDMAADANKDGSVMLSELEDYVYDKVSELSKGKQVPTARRENLEFDFRIW